jgi:hypothetical protein
MRNTDCASIKAVVVFTVRLLGVREKTLSTDSAPDSISSGVPLSLSGEGCSLFSCPLAVGSSSYGRFRVPWPFDLEVTCRGLSLLGVSPQSLFSNSSGYLASRRYPCGLLGAKYGCKIWITQNLVNLLCDCRFRNPSQMRLAFIALQSSQGVLERGDQK